MVDLSNNTKDNTEAHRYRKNNSVVDITGSNKIKHI